MKVVLFDTRTNDAQKDFAGGMGVGMYPGGGGVRGRIVRAMYRRDYRPVAMNFAYLAAIFKKLGHEVEYVEDRLPAADLFIFNPSLLTLGYEIEQIRKLKQRIPAAQILLVGTVAYALADTLEETMHSLGCKVLRGEPEMLLWKLDEVLNTDQTIVDIGAVKCLDELPVPDWSSFDYRRFKIKYDFWKFPTAMIQQSRGCTFKCNYCPYIMVESKTRFRDPEAVVDEIRVGIERYGFKSFKFRDPLFGLDRKRALAVCEGILRLPRKIQFSIETRIDLMRDETLSALKEAGLTSITVGIETPNENTLKKYKRAPIKDDRQREFVIKCREKGIRTVAGFMVGFPDDTEDNIRWVMNYARQVNPTFANFNVVTPYPGTPFFNEVRDQIANHDFSKYSVYHPVMKYRHLTSEQVAELHSLCFTKYYFRSRYFYDNGRLLWPKLSRLLPVYSAQPSKNDANGELEATNEDRTGTNPMLPVIKANLDPTTSQRPDQRAA